MTQTEFETRTKVAVSSKEFEAINEVYMNSDLDKDNFCAIWCKMNASRVSAAKSEALKKALEEARREFAYNLLNQPYTWETSILFACDYFTEKVAKQIDSLGISFIGTRDNGFDYAKTVGDVLYEVRLYLNK